LASSGLLAILAVTASSVLWSLSTSFKKSLSSALSVLTIYITAKTTTSTSMTPTLTTPKI
jgi:hypothetical protein